VTTQDIIYMVNFIFKGGKGFVPCTAIADLNLDGRITVGDLVRMLVYVFYSGPEPPNACTAIGSLWSCP